MRTIVANGIGNFCDENFCVERPGDEGLLAIIACLFACFQMIPERRHDTICYDTKLVVSSRIDTTLLHFLFCLLFFSLLLSICLLLYFSFLFFTSSAFTSMSTRWRHILYGYEYGIRETDISA